MAPTISPWRRLALDIGIFGQSERPYVELQHDDALTLASQAQVSVPGSGQDTQAISDLDWRIVAMQHKAEALKSVDTQTRNSIALFVAITALVGIAAVFLARIITNPIVHLKAVAEKVASGDFNAEAKVSTRDEVGTLAATFNNMTLAVKKPGRFPRTARGRPHPRPGTGFRSRPRRDRKGRRPG